MTNEELYRLRFPVGEFDKPEQVTSQQIEAWIAEIAAFPAAAEALTSGLGKEELNWRYRPDGWNIKQVVHHCSDSHINAMIRFKLTLTEDGPTIKPYREDLWAELVDGQDDDLSLTLSLLAALHAKWVKVLRSMQPKDMERVYYHPEYGKPYTLDEAIGNYAWHCRHHLAHVEQALAAQGKYN